MIHCQGKYAGKIKSSDSMRLSMGCLSCASYYLSYLARADMNILSTMAATALASIRRRVCSH
jgi:hypothetical protein